MKSRLYSVLMVLALLALVGGAAAAPMTRNYRAHLNGANELPVPVDTLAQGQALFQFNKDGSALTYKLILANIENVTMAHIHVAPAAGQNGPPVLWLYPDAPPPQLIPGRTDGVLAERTVMAADLVGPLAGSADFSGLRQAIMEGRAYVNVHTSQFPAGEVRGDIH